MNVLCAFIGLSLALLSPAHSQNIQLDFESYQEQCPGSFFNIFHPHTIYDSPFFGGQSPVGKVADALGLLQKITESGNQVNADSVYIPNPIASNMNITRSDLRTLIKVVRLPFIIADRPLQERIGLEIPTAGLTTVAADMCKLVQHRLSGVYKPFNCTEEQLVELDARLQYSDLLDQHLAQLATLTPTLPSGQCKYWNSRGLDNCVSGNTLTQNEVTVHEQLMIPQYAQFCQCDVGPDYAPLCGVQTSA